MFQTLLFVFKQIENIELNCLKTLLLSKHLFSELHKLFLNRFHYS